MRLLECAKIVTTHGIKGEVKIKIITDDLERFSNGTILYVGNNKENVKEIKVDGFRPIKDMGLLSFNGITNINDCLEYVGKSIYVDTDMYENDDIYYDDLIDCKVFDGDIYIGIVSDVMEVPQGAILCIKRDNNKDALVPFVDEFIKLIDIQKKEIIIKSIEGLL